MRGIVYGLVCPVTGKIRYVGQTVSKSANERLGDHLRGSFYSKPSYTHKENWIKKVHTASSPVTVVVLEELNGEQREIDERERFWITQFPDLTNLADGGTSGYSYPPEVRKKIAASKQGEKNPMWGKQVVFTAEQRARIGAGLRNSLKFQQSRASKEYRDKISAIQSVHTWLVLDETEHVVEKFKNAREVAAFFSRKLGKGMTIGNVKNARRFKRPIGKQLDSWFYVCYEEDYEQAL